MSKPSAIRKSSAFILGLGTALPEHRYDQAELAETLLKQVPLPTVEAGRLRRMAAACGIATRHSVLPDYQAYEPGGPRLLYPDNPDFEPAPNLEARMRCFHEQAQPLALRAIKTCFERCPQLERGQITHLIAVSCTGLAAPGLDLMLLKALELPPHTHRTAVNFMGCYAAMHALKQADAICRADSEALVLVVCVELCTLHFQKDPTPDNLAASLLFADGAAAVLIGGADHVNPAGGAEHIDPAGTPAPIMRLDGFYSEVAFEGWQDMAWQLSGQGFLMKLSAYVPELLRVGIRPLVERALDRLGLSLDAVDHWALHPGGRRILDLAKEELELPPGALDVAYEVLASCGNMSSPTVLFVLDRLHLQPGQRVLAAAFGPGLTMETLVATVHA
ncbi:MAG: type III polyketide synthase [Candidatus Sericytochromatia bacterium]